MGQMLPSDFMIAKMRQSILCPFFLTLLLADTDGPPSSTRRLRMLPSYSQTPEVTEATVRPDLLQPFQIFTKLAFHAICQDLCVLAIDDIPLSIEEPCWNLVLRWALDNGNDSLKFFRRNLSSTVAVSLRPGAPQTQAGVPLVQIHISFLAHQVGVASPNTLDLGQGVHDLLLAIDIGVEETEDELEVALLGADQS